jgi:hypothetical protein
LIGAGSQRVKGQLGQHFSASFDLQHSPEKSQDHLNKKQTDLNKKLPRLRGQVEKDTFGESMNRKSHSFLLLFLTQNPSDIYSIQGTGRGTKKHQRQPCPLQAQRPA